MPSDILPLNISEYLHFLVFVNVGIINIYIFYILLNYTDIICCQFDHKITYNCKSFQNLLTPPQKKKIRRFCKLLFNANSSSVRAAGVESSPCWTSLVKNEPTEALHFFQQLLTDEKPLGLFWRWSQRFVGRVIEVYVYI